MKKSSFLVLYLAVACIVTTARTAFASEAQEGEVLSFVVEERKLFSRSDETIPISIPIQSFNQAMQSKMSSSVNTVYNTRKVNEDHIAFSIVAVSRKAYHNITCRITGEITSGLISSYYKLIFHNCGNEEVRFRENIIILQKMRT